MYLAHLGLAVFILGASVSENNKIEREIILELGSSTKIGSYEYRLDEISETMKSNYDAIIATVSVFRNNVFVTSIKPEKRLYHSSDSPMTEAGIFPRFERDLYVSLGNMVDDNKWLVRIYDKPLIRFIWIGAILMVIGSILTIKSKRKLKNE